jgi:hypothetical protein
MEWKWKYSWLLSAYFSWITISKVTKLKLLFLYLIWYNPWCIWTKYNNRINLLVSGFGGLVVSILASGTWVQTRPKPSEFFGPKTPQHTLLRKGSKAVCPMSQICGMLKNPVNTWNLGHRQNLLAIFSLISSLANRGPWGLRGVERLWIWRKELRAVHRGSVT